MKSKFLSKKLDKYGSFFLAIVNDIYFIEKDKFSQWF